MFGYTLRSSDTIRRRFNVVLGLWLKISYAECHEFYKLPMGASWVRASKKQIPTILREYFFDKIEGRPKAQGIRHQQGGYEVSLILISTLSRRFYSG